jgi:hypothetical protein
VRTGTVIDVIDVSQPSTAIGFEGDERHRRRSSGASVPARRAPAPNSSVRWTAAKPEDRRGSPCRTCLVNRASGAGRPTNPPRSGSSTVRRNVTSPRPPAPRNGASAPTC